LPRGDSLITAARHHGHYRYHRLHRYECRLIFFVFFPLPTFGGQMFRFCPSAFALIYPSWLYANDSSPFLFVFGVSTDCILFHTGQCLLWLHSSSCRVVGKSVWRSYLLYDILSCRIISNDHVQRGLNWPSICRSPLITWHCTLIKGWKMGYGRGVCNMGRKMGWTWVKCVDVWNYNPVMSGNVEWNILP